MKDFYVHFCQDDNILRRYDVDILNNEDTDVSRYSSLTSTQKGILTMQKLFRAYLYNTFHSYNPYPEHRCMVVQLTTSIKEFKKNNVYEISYFEIDGNFYLYGFKTSIFGEIVTFYVLAI